MKSWGKSNFAGGAVLLLGLLSTLPSLSYAVDFSNKFTINGFYTLDASLSDGEDVILPSTSGTPNTLKEGEVSYDNSLVGLQADYSITGKLDLTVQAISSKQIEGDYSPTLEWAYLSYDLGNDLHLRGGKLKLPFLQGTELRYVGFSRLWVRPIVPSNGAGGFDDYQGGEIIKGATLGEYNLRFQGAYGKADHQQDFVDDRDVKLLSTRIEKDESWINLALFQANYDIYTKDGLHTIQKNAEVLMGSIEAELLYQKTILNIGYAYGDAEQNPDEQLAYLSLGYRANRFTPFALYQYRLMEYTPPDLPAPPGSPAPQAKDGTFKINTFALGFRYDLGATYAIKAQVDHQIINDSSISSLGELEKETNIYTIVFEGVF